MPVEFKLSDANKQRIAYVALLVVVCALNPKETMALPGHIIESFDDMAIGVWNFITSPILWEAVRFVVTAALCSVLIAWGGGEIIASIVRWVRRAKSRRIKRENEQHLQMLREQAYYDNGGVGGL